MNTIVNNSYLVNEDGELGMINDHPSPGDKDFIKTFKQHFRLFSFSNKLANKVALIFLSLDYIRN